MKKIFLPLAACVLTGYLSKAQGVKAETKDPDVQEMQANRKTAAPFSVSFKDEASYKTADAFALFTKYLSLNPATDELRFVKKDASGDISVSHFRQYFRGIKVEQGSYALTAKNDKVAFITGDFYSVAPGTNIQPFLTEAQALTKALEYIGADTYKWQLPAEESFIKQESGNPTATYYPKGELVLTEDFKTGKELNGKVFIAYKFNVYAQQPLSRTNIYVDAVSGKILLADDIIKHHGNAHPDQNNIPAAVCNEPAASLAPTAVGTAATRYSGTVNIATRLVGANYNLISSIASEGYPLHTKNMQKGTVYGSAVEFNDGDNNWTAAEFNNANFDDAGLDAHWGAAKVYDYWTTRHSRNSYDGAGAVINSYVHYSSNYDNAYWDGVEMTYGDGTRVNGGFLPLTALDVCGHEIGHAVCSSVVGAGAGLTYNRESGAMNEGFSDIWGASIEHFADPHETDAVAKSYFDIGEEIGLPLPTPLRSMSNPKLYGQPDTYLKTNWVDATTTGCPTPNSNTNDNCGVHTNSGVLNHWFYLLVVGGTGTNDNGNSFAVPAIGWVDAEHITFLGEQNLATTANYAACRTAMINASTTLFGACSLQTEAVTRAWYAVGVGVNFVPCTAQIGFRDVALSVNENAGVGGCPAVKTATVRMMVEGPVPTGGNATVTVTATGTAANGIDYTIGTGTATFIAGSTADQNIILNIIDDAAVEATENIILDFTLAQNGSTATKSNAYTQSIVSIIDNDTIPELGTATVAHTVGTYNTNSSLTSIFKSATKAARSQFIWTAAELLAAGVRTNAPISAMSVNVVTKSSTNPYTGYTVAMGNTALAAAPATFAGGLTTVYSGNYSSTTGTNTITFSTPFLWDGTSNLVMQVCFTNTTAAAAANDVIQGYTPGTTAYTGYATSTTGGCTLTTASTSTAKPLINFTQTIPPVNIESTLSSNRIQQTFSGSNSYFYNAADNAIIAAVTANNQDLGCVSATLSQAGAGFTPMASFSSTKRSLKEATIKPAINGSTTNYNATIYFTDAEIAGKSLASILLLKTNALTDAAINSGNTVIVTPTIVYGTNWKGFSGNFTGFSRFFLIDNNLLPVTGLIAEAYLQNGHINIKWKTETESNSAHFDIQRSYDGIHFTKITEQAAAGTSVTERQYAVTDADMPQSINYYRVQLVNANGSTMMSPIVSVKIGTKALISVTPNPVHDQFAVQYNNTGKSVITIFDATGRKVKQFNTTGNSGSISVDGSSFAPGVYIVTLGNDKNETITQKFIKN